MVDLVFSNASARLPYAASFSVYQATAFAACPNRVHLTPKAPHAQETARHKLRAAGIALHKKTLH